MGRLLPLEEVVDLHAALALDLDVVGGVELEAGVQAAEGGEVDLRWSGAMPVIGTYHLGSPSDIDDTALALEAWGQDNGYRPTGKRCEVYHFDWRAPLANWVTEIQLIIENAR